MGSEAVESEPISTTLKLPLLNTITPLRSPDRPGMLTPPLHTTASVPFRWEEEPGKPRPCTALIPADPTNYNKCLELPPRLQIVADYSSKLTKMPSPTTVLDGPYVFRSSSLRFRRECQRQGSFGSGGWSPERGLLGAMVLSNSRLPEAGKETRGFFGSWGGKPSLKRGRKKVRGGSFDLSCSNELEDFGGEEIAVASGGARVKKTSGMRRNGSFSNLSNVRSHFWTTIYEGFKQVFPWKSRK